MACCGKNPGSLLSSVYRGTKVIPQNGTMDGVEVVVTPSKDDKKNG